MQEETIEETTEESIIEESLEDSTAESIDESSEEPTEEIPGKPVDESNDEPQEDSQDEASDRNLDRLDTKELGRRGEQAAVRFLERKGIEILERNWTCLAGEADIIAFDDEALRFVEVKTRTDVSKGFPSEAVTKKKRQRYEKIAALYLQESDFPECRVTFDVIAILVTGSHRAFLKYHRDAFAFDVAR